MKISLLLVAGNNERFIAVATEAANAVFPGATVVRIDSLAEALGLPPASVPELLLLADASEAEIGQAARALDAGRLPRWAVVARGPFDSIPLAYAVPEAEWTPALLSRVFKSAVALLALHRDRERLRGDLLSVGIRISHDLRTPVGGIISATEVLEGQMAEDKQDNKALTLPLLESANDLVKIIGQLSLVTKASARPDSRERVSMSAPVGRALERVEMRARGKGATVSKAASWPEALVEPALIEAVWVALLDNAIRYSEKAPAIELGWQAEGETNKFWVRDNGAGVPSEKRRSLFRPFHRLHEPNSPRGLGLAIVERLVSIHGGVCGYEALEPSGSVFFFSLPR